jgi:hypothetical protein
MILSGGERITDIYRLRNDPVIPDLFGNGSVPYDTTARNDLLLMADEYQAKEKFLLELNDILLKHSRAKHMTIDIDGTASEVHGHQSMARRGYTSSGSSQRCFQHLLVSWDEMNSPLYVETRAGNRHCSFNSEIIMKKVLDHYAGKVDTILVRADSGFYSQKILQTLESYDNVSYVMKAKVRYSKLDLIPDRKFKYYHDSLRQYAKMEHEIGDKIERSYYVERRCKDKEIYLFEELSFDYEAIVSNVKNLQPHSIFRLYNKRGRQEKLIGELKSEFALGKIVSNDFGITQTGSWVSAVACAIIAIFRKVALRQEYRKLEMKRLRYFFINVVAKFVKHAGQKILQIFSPTIGRYRYDQVIGRILALE